MAQKRNKRKGKHRKKHRLIFPVFILCVVLLACIILVTNHLYLSSSPYVKNEPSPIPQTTAQSSLPSPSAASASRSVSKSGVKATAAPTSTPKSTAKPTTKPTKKPSSEEQKSDGVVMAEYSDDIYGFTCPYIKSFSVYGGDDPDAVYSLRSPDGGAYEHIFVNEASAETPAMAMREFVSSYPTGIIMENHAGDSYFYALIKYDDNYVYRYAAYLDGVEMGFEFGYTENTKSVYSEYPEEIKDDFYLH